MLLACCLANGQITLDTNQLVVADDTSGADVLSDDQWRLIDSLVERGLAWLAKQQQPDGSFQPYRMDSPASRVSVFWHS